MSTEDIGLNEPFSIGEDRDIGEATWLVYVGVYQCIGERLDICNMRTY